MPKLRVLTLICLLSCLSSCASYSCPSRTPFTGETYGDLVTYTGDLEIVYDSCSAKAGKINWDIVDNSFATEAKQPANTINLTNNVH